MISKVKTDPRGLKQIASYGRYQVVFFNNGDTYHYRDGQLHRDNDKPAREYADGTKCWHTDGS